MGCNFLRNTIQVLLITQIVVIFLTESRAANHEVCIKEALTHFINLLSEERSDSHVNFHLRDGTAFSGDHNITNVVRRIVANTVKTAQPHLKTPSVVSIDIRVREPGVSYGKNGSLDGHQVNMFTDTVQLDFRFESQFSRRIQMQNYYQEALAHEIGHLIFKENLCDRVPLYRFFFEQLRLGRDDPRPSGLPNLPGYSTETYVARIRGLVLPYEELFADLTAVLVTGDASGNANAAAAHDNQMFSHTGYSSTARDFPERNFSANNQVNGWHGTTAHALFGPVRSWLWNNVLLSNQSNLDPVSESVIMEKVINAMARDINSRAQNPEHLYYLGPEEANRRMIAELQREFQIR